MYIRKQKTAITSYMKKNNLFLIFLFLTFKFFAQEITAIDIHSTYLNEIKVVKIFIPEGYEESRQRYPLTLVIDSETLFDSYVADAKLFSKNKAVPKQIILGITHFATSNKSRDYGFNVLNSFPHENSMNTLNFIKEELIPRIKNDYRIAYFKTVVANDLTANFINYFIFDNKPVFSGYISINPELAPDMPDYMKRYATQIKGDDTYYYMSHGNNTEKKKLEVINATDVGLIGVSNVYFNYRFENFKKTNNLISTPQAIASAMEYVYSMYSPIDDEEFEKNISYLSPLAAMEYLQYKYENIEYLFGERIPIRQEDFVRLESIVIDEEDGEHLLEYGELALKVHPTSPLGNYYNGQFYEKSKEYDEALLAYKKGYAKIPESSPKSIGYFMNIKRVLSLQKLEQEALNEPMSEEELEEDSLEEEETSQENEETPEETETANE